MVKNSFSWLRERWRALAWFFDVPHNKHQSLVPQQPSLPMVKPQLNPRREGPKLGNERGIIEPIEDPFTSSNHKKYFQYLVDCHHAVELANVEDTFTLMLEDVFVPSHLALAPYFPVDQLQLPHMALAKLRQAEQSIWQFVGLERVPGLVIIGLPGSGKTSLLKYMALNLADKEKRLRGEVPNQLPILLSLRHYGKIINRNPDYTLAEAVESSYLSHMLEPLTDDWFEQHLKAGQCIVMLDGLDEIADPIQRDSMTRWVEQQIDRYAKNRFIITSRPLPYFSNPISGATVLKIQPFNKKQTPLFVERWYLANQINNVNLEANASSSSSVRMAAQGIEDLTQLCAELPCSAFATSPLLLTMIATMHRYRISLPSTRAELYGEICHLFLNSSERHVEFDLTPAQKLHVLQPLAYHMMRHKLSEIELEEASRVIYVTLDIISRNPKGHDFLQMVADSSALFKEQENGKYRFVHRTFQEYLAAVHMLEYRLEGQLIKHVEDSWWHETICLYGSRTDATPIIAACLRETTPSANALIMACRCVLEAHHIQPEWQNKLEGILEQYVEDDDSILRRFVTETLLLLRLRRMMPVNNNLSVAESLITNVEYQLFIDDQRTSHFKPVHWFSHAFRAGDGLKPVVGVRPSQAVAFCQWLTERDKESRSYRLPYTGEFNPLLSKVGYWSQDEQDHVYTLENEQPVALSITALEHRLRSVLVSDLYYNPDEALERVRDLARALEALFERDNEAISREALIFARDFAHERAHHRALNIKQSDTALSQDTNWYAHFISWLVTEKLVTILRQQPKPRSWLDAFDRDQGSSLPQPTQAKSLTEQYFELYVDLANLEEQHQSQLLASRGIRIVARTPLRSREQRKRYQKPKNQYGKQKNVTTPTFIPQAIPALQGYGSTPIPTVPASTERKIIQKKICLLGDEAVGKTSLVRRYVEGRFDEKYISTMGVTISRKTLVRPTYTMNMLVWDIEGSSTLKKIQVNYLRGAAGALIVCDLTRRETFAAFERYAHQLRALNKNVPFVLIGNKVDLNQRAVLGAELEKISKELNVPYLLTSAKTGTQVEEAFKILADLIEKQQK